MSRTDWSGACLDEKLRGEMGEAAALIELRFFDREMPANRVSVGDGEVVAFHKILSQAFPVGVPDMILFEDRHIILHVVRQKFFRQLGKHVRHRRHVRVKADINPAQIFLTSDRGKLDIRFVKTAGPVHIGSADKLAVEIVGPGVIGAGEFACVPAPLDKTHHPVATDI